MSFFNFSKQKECEMIRSQIYNYSPILVKFVDFQFKRNNINDPDKILKWIISIIDRLKNNNDQPLINYEKITINKNFVLDNYLNENKDLLSFKQQNDIFRLFKVVNIKFDVHWILWNFSEALSNPLLFICIFPTIYKSYVGKNENIENKSQSNSKNIQTNNIMGSTQNLFYKKSQFELVIDRYLPLLQITNDYFKEKLLFFTFLLDQAIQIALTEFSELVNTHLPLILTDFTDEKQKNGQFSKKRIMRKIDNSISIFNRDLEIISNFYKIEIYQKIAQINRQLIIFNLFTKRYQKVQKSLRININDIKINGNNKEYIYFIRKIINCINNFKETQLISMMKLFSKDSCPDFHFTMINFIINNSNFKKDMFSFSEVKKQFKSLNIENSESSECSTEIEASKEKSDKTEISNDQKNKEQLLQEVSQIIQLTNIKDHFYFTKLCFSLSEQGFSDHNDILYIVQISNKCRRAFSALSIHKLLRIASSNAILSRTALWGFNPLNSNPEGFPDRMFGSPGVITVIVYFIMRAFEFLIISSIPNKYRTKQRLTADTILTFYKRAIQSHDDILKKEKEELQSKNENLNNTNNNNDKNINNDNDSYKVENNDSYKVENDDSYKVENNDSFKVENNDSFKVENNDSFKVENNDSYKVENNDDKNDCGKLNNKNNNDEIENEMAEISNIPVDNGTFQENDENVNNNINFKLYIKRGFQMIKESIEIGFAMMNLFNSKNISLFNNEIKNFDLLSFLDYIQNNTKKKLEMNEKIKKSSFSKRAFRKRGVVVIDMINIGFAIINDYRFSLAMPIYFKKIYDELTKMPLQKYDLKNMCANFEPDFPLRKEVSPSMKNIFLKVQDEAFLKKLTSISNSNDFVKSENENENETEKQITPNNPSTLDSKNIIYELTEKINTNESQILNKKVDAND